MPEGVVTGLLKEVDNRLTSILPSFLLQQVQRLDALGQEKLGLEHIGAAVVLSLIVFIAVTLLVELGECCDICFSPPNHQPLASIYCGSHNHLISCFWWL